MDDVQEKIFGLFAPNAKREVTRIREKGTRFVHYTSAESGLAILRSGRMLLRNSTLMNDFSEVQHGMDCLFAAYNGAPGEALKELMRKVQPDLPEVFEASFNAQLLDCRAETYLLSISEHGDLEHGDELEDAFGRLSMWRAYAGKNGIAFVFKNTPFVTETNVLNAFTSPVVYSTIDAFATFFNEVVDGLKDEADLVVSLGGQYVHNALMTAFRFAIQSTKHPAFREEREWRVIYTPTLLPAEVHDIQKERIPTEVMSLGGAPQRVYGIPFKNYPDEGFVGATIPELIDRVLIGPSANAYAISQAFVDELKNMGLADAGERVFVTGIPLRT